jgi:hypothetical protein
MTDRAGRTIRWRIADDGLCKAVLVGEAPEGESLIPLSITPLSRNRRIYGSWRRNNEDVIVLQRFRSRVKIYNGELTMARVDAL